MIVLNSIKSKFGQTVLPALFLAANIFFFAPFAVYQGNLDEFFIGLQSLLSLFVLPALGLAIALSIVAAVLPGEMSRRFAAVIFALGILTWLQGNVLLWDYGVIGKGDIAWDQYRWRAWIDGGLWAGLLIAAFFFYKKLAKVITFASAVLIILQLCYAGLASYQKPEIWTHNVMTSETLLPAGEIFGLSSKLNVIHVILDELQTGVFEEILQNAPHYRDDLDGFTHFSNATSSFPTTIVSIPSILGGQIYKNDVPMEDFIDKTFRGKTIPNVLYDHGYEVDLAASLDWYAKGRYSHWFQVPVPYGLTWEEYKASQATLLLDIALYRSTPQVIKAVIFDSHIGEVIGKGDGAITAYEAKRHFAHEEFLKDLVARSSVATDKPVYKFFHFNTTHYPAVLNIQCEDSGQVLPWNWGNIKVQAFCCFAQFMEYIEMLKALNVYDSSLIVIQADHGYYKVPESEKQVRLKNADHLPDEEFKSKEYFAKVVSSSRPLLAIKPPFSNGPLKTSAAPVMLADIPATISTLLGLNVSFPGRSVFDIRPDEVRERGFAYYDELSSKGYFKRLDKYVISGDVLDRGSWRLAGIANSRKVSYKTSEVDFGTVKAHDYFRSGWALSDETYTDGKTFNWALGENASIFLSLPQGEARLSARTISPFPAGKQSVTVKVDGRKIGHWKSTTSWQWEDHSVIIGANSKRPAVSVVEFTFSKYMASNREGPDNRPLAVLFDFITLEDTGAVAAAPSR